MLYDRIARVYGEMIIGREKYKDTYIIYIDESLPIRYTNQPTSDHLYSFQRYVSAPSSDHIMELLMARSQNRNIGVRQAFL